jgi:MtrB/PioB family decaheme-associated outer membrane protein
LALNWIGDKGHLTGSYFASIFQDGYNSLSWSNPFVDTTPAAPGVSPSTTGSNNGEFPVNTFATPPSNSLSQLNLLGGYDFTPDLKLAGGLSYSINTQNSSFINDPLMPTPPQASLNGLEATTHADLKLTDQVSKDLLLSAGVKYDDHDNRTQTNTFSSFNSIAGDTWGALVNTPMSNRDLQLLLDGNYRFDKKQSVSVAYEFDKVNRWCNNTLANTFQSQDPNANLAYYTNTGCAQSPESNENKLTAGYKLKAGDGIIFKTSYTYARRVAAISSFYNPMQTSADGFENLGFMAFFDASRTEQSIKAGVDWQNSEKLNTGLSGRYIDDKYDAMFGVQQNQTWSLNLDAAYDYSRDGSVSAYLTTQLRQRDLLSGAGVGSGVGQSPLAISTNVWSNQLTDESNMVGIKAKQKGLLGGKLDLAGDLSYSIGKTGYSTQTQNCTDTAACGTSATNSGALPDIKNEILKLKVTGNYHVNKASKVTVGYRFQKQTTSDYYYGAYQTGYTDPGVLPTNQQAPSYSVNVLSVSYLYSF